MILALVLGLLFCADGYSQNGRCIMKLVELPQAPELLGFRPGMTMEQVKLRVPQVVFGPKDDFGSSRTTINPDFDARIDKSSFAGVRSVSLDFLDGRITSLWFGYDSGFKWLTVEDFVKGISQSLRLTATWTPWKSRGEQLRCADFQMTVTIIAEGPSFRIVDQTAEDTLAARREAKEEGESAATEESDTADVILGDKHNKIYYPSGCQHARGPEETNRVVFKTKEEAEKAGYKQTKSCP